MSQQEASNFCKVEGINVISSILYDVILDMTSALSLWRVKVINELVAKNDENRTKLMVRHSKIMMIQTSLHQLISMLYHSHNV